MADLPDGMLGPGDAAGNGTAESTSRGYAVPGTLIAESPDGGGVGDSPVRGTLVSGVEAEGKDVSGGYGGLVAHAGPSAPASKLTTEGLKRVAKADSRVRRRVEHIVATHLQGYRYDISKDKPEGVSDADWRIIRASYSNMKASPAWLTNAVKMWDTLKKADADRPQAPTINAQFVQVNVVQSNDMPVRRIKGE